MKLFYLDKSFWLFMVIIILCGLFNNFFLYFILLVMHELGHTLIGIILGYKIDCIKIYPYGGITLFKDSYNKSLKSEFFVLIAGPCMQVITYLILKKFIHYDYLSIYHYTLLIFNLLPIYPLDGGKIINIFLNYRFNYKLSFYLSFFSSLLIIIILIIYCIIKNNLNLLLMLIVLITKLGNLYRNRQYDYNNFLLDRYLHHYSFNKLTCINDYRHFYRDKRHIIKMENEIDFLKKYFEKP